MDNKTIAIIVGVVVVVAAVAAVVFIMNNNNSGGDDGDKEYNIPNTKMLVFGNANNDDYLDSKDVTFIQAIIDGTATWSKDVNVLADANVDGVIDSKDVDLVKGFLSGKKSTMYYLNWYGQKREISYPLSGNIAGSYVDIAALAYIDGVYGDITSIRATQETLDSLDPVQFPGAAGKWKSVSDDTNTTFNVEKLLAQKVKVILTDPDFLANGLDKKIRDADKSINLIELPINRAVGEVDWTHTVVTLGAMYNNQDKTEDYVEFVEDIESTIKEKMSEIKQKYPDQTFLICYEPKSATTTSLDIFGTGLVQYGDVINMVRLPLTCAVDPVGPSGWVEDYAMEDVIKVNPTVIAIESWGQINTKTPEEYRATLEKWVGYFEQTGAYKNDKVVTFAYEVYGTVPGIAGMILMGSLIWPDVFDYDEGLEYLDYYYRNFTTMGADWDITEHYGFLPELWGAHVN